MGKNHKGEKEYIKELFIKYKENQDPAIREELIEKHLYIAEILAKKYLNRGIEYDDIFQVASLGLIYAIDRFDVEKGFEFSSFATPTIIGEIKRHFRDKGWAIRVPRRIQETSKDINDAKLYLAQELQRVPSISDLADYLNITEEEVLETMEASKVYTAQSLDVSFENSSEDSEVFLKDFIGEEDEHYLKIENKDFINDLIKNLNEVEKTILIDRYFNRKTQVSIAEKLDVSQMTVSRIEKRVLEKLRREIESQTL